MIYENEPMKLIVTKGIKDIYVTANMGIKEVDGGYECEAIHLEMNEKPTYDSLITALIRVRYSSDKMEAIINNYLLDADEKAKSEFEAMQEWRMKCKRFAKEVYEDS